MGVSIVKFNGETLIDISDSTVTADMLPEGVVAYDREGNRIVGRSKTLSFSIYDGYSGSIVFEAYDASQGLKWGRYVQLNPDTLFMSEGCIYYDGYTLYDSDGNVVYPDDVIVLGATYYINN